MHEIRALFCGHFVCPAAYKHKQPQLAEHDQKGLDPVPPTEEEKPKPKYCLTLITFDIFLIHIKDRRDEVGPGARTSAAAQRAKLVFNFVSRRKLICLVRWPNRTRVKLTFKRPVGNTKSKTKQDKTKQQNTQEKGK